jgi:hypothetical protein
MDYQTTATGGSHRMNGKIIFNLSEVSIGNGLFKDIGFDEKGAASRE